eukprot:267743_1
MLEEILFQFAIYSIIVTNAYLPETQLSAIYDLYSALNGDQWTGCQWNLTYLATNNSLPFDYCGLMIDIIDIHNDTNTIFYTITGIYIYNEPSNINGTIPDTIENLIDLDTFLIANQPLLYGSIPQTFCNLQYIEEFAVKNIGIQYIPNCIAESYTLTDIRLYEMKNVSIHNSILSTLCNHAKNLQVLKFANLPLFKGYIPNCIGNELLQLQIISFYELPQLQSTIPQSFNNFTKLTQLELSMLPGLIGTFPDKIFENNINLTLIIIDHTNLNGSLPNECNNPSLQLISIWYNPYISWQIPECIGTFINLKTFQIGHQQNISANISGTIPEEICNLYDLFVFYVPNAFITGTIPNCLFHLPNLMYIGLNNNYLTGTIPPLYLPNIKVFNLHNNALKGSLSDILILDKYINLETLALHYNKLYDKDISNSLKKLFMYSSHLKVITLFENDHLSGNLPLLEEDTHLNELFVFAAQKMDIGGKLPHNLFVGANITNRAVISLYNNRLCSDLPNNFLKSNLSNNSLVIINGNLFSLRTGIIPNWILPSKFIQAQQLYLTVKDHAGSWVVLIIGIIASIIVIIKIKLLKNIKTKDTEMDENPHYVFIKEIKTMVSMVTDYTFLTLILCLCLLYPLLCNYYSVGVPVLSYFCLFFLETENILLQLFLCVLMIIYNILIFRMICKFITEYKPLENISQQIEMRKITDILTEPMIPKSEDVEINNTLNFALIKWIRFVWYLYLYGFGILILLAYIISESLPGDNIIYIHQNIRHYLSISIYFVMAINNSIVTPNFIHSLLDLSNI